MSRLSPAASARRGTPGVRNSSRYHRAVGPTRHPAELADAFAEFLTPAASRELRAVPDAGKRLRKLAMAFRPVFSADDDAAAAKLLNGLLRSYRAQPYLVEDVGQPFHLHFHGDAGTAVESFGGEFATALALAVDTYGERRFGLCEAAQCDRVYVDLTKNGSRRYCGDGCSARAKMAAYRDRKAAARSDYRRRA